MFLEKNHEVQDLMLKQRRLVLPVSVTAAAGDITATSAKFNQVTEVGEGTGLVATVKIKKVEASEVLAITASAGTLGAATVDGNGDINVTLTVADGATTASVITVEYLSEQ